MQSSVNDLEIKLHPVRRV